MSRHNKMPPVPPANRSPKGTGGNEQDIEKGEMHKGAPENAAEQGETANIRQNTTNAGFFHGRRVKER